MKKFKVSFSGYIYINAENQQNAEDIIFNQFNLPDGTQLEATEEEKEIE